jgi:hypothetical protein
LIVVVGVCIGLQVNNWNPARAGHAQECVFLAQLRGEVVGSVAVIGSQSRYVGEVGASGRRAVAYLKGDED